MYFYLLCAIMAIQWIWPRYPITKKGCAVNLEMSKQARVRGFDGCHAEATCSFFCVLLHRPIRVSTRPLRASMQLVSASCVTVQGFLRDWRLSPSGSRNWKKSLNLCCKTKGEQSVRALCWLERSRVKLGAAFSLSQILAVLAKGEPLLQVCRVLLLVCRMQLSPKQASHHVRNKMRVSHARVFA